MAADNFFENDVPRCYGPNSYDLRMSENVRWIRPEKEHYNLTEEHSEENYKDLTPTKRTIGGREYDAIRLFKGHSIIVKSIEVVKIPQGYIGLCSPRSNLSYILDFHHSNLIDTGYEGVITARISSAFHTIDIPIQTRFLQVMIAKSENVDQLYTERASSKNLNHKEKLKIKFKIDREFRFGR